MDFTEILLFDEAVQICTAYAKPTRHEVVPISEACGRVLTRDATAQVDVPPFERAMMDGYAVIGRELSEPGNRFVVVGSSSAGHPWEGAIQPGQSIRITTGAPLPVGADTVIRQEWCQVQEDGSMTALRPVKTGESVQSCGNDGRMGQVVLTAGRTLTATDVAICRAFGIADVQVAHAPTVAVLVTGDELIQDVRSQLDPGQIYGTNDLFIAGAVTADGASVVMCEYIADDPNAIRSAVKRAAGIADYVIVTGGVSVGVYDFVPAVLQDLGAHLSIRHIFMRPGSPFVAAVLGDTRVFGLSGNPAACFIQFETLVRPVIRRTLGVPEQPFPTTGKLSHALNLKPIKHMRVFRARAAVVNAEIRVDASHAQSPGVISSFAETNCLIRIDESEIPAGAILPLRWTKPL